MLRLHGSTSVVVFEASVEAIFSLAADDVGVARLTDAGVCEGSLSNSILYTST